MILSLNCIDVTSVRTPLMSPEARFVGAGNGVASASSTTPTPACNMLLGRGTGIGRGEVRRAHVRVFVMELGNWTELADGACKHFRVVILEARGRLSP